MQSHFSGKSTALFAGNRGITITTGNLEQDGALR
jgi:hypothetical protein